MLQLFIEKLMLRYRPRREYVDTMSIVQNRHRISRILQGQEPIEDAFAGLAFEDPGGISNYSSYTEHKLKSLAGRRTPRPPSRPSSRTQSRPSFSNSRSQSFASFAANMSPTWSDESENGIYPPVPDPPSFSPLSPTTSNGTWTSSSSATRVPIAHWATKIYDGKFPRTPMLLTGEASQCYGRAENPAIMQRLADEQFIDVIRQTLDADFHVRLYWRPSDHRARMLCIRKDGANVITHYCIPLTGLKLCRKESQLLFFRLDRETREFNLWAALTFRFYEPLVLFYCAFTAMKRQDHAGSHELLQDKYHQKGSEEKEEYAGEIKDDNFLHTIRIYRDKTSGCLRLEARARRGSFTATPIWTAFVTRAMLRKPWIKVVGLKILQLTELHPYSFCPQYTPPTSKSGKFKLQFTSAGGKAAL
jgi:hypothetical protein